MMSLELAGACYGVSKKRTFNTGALDKAGDSQHENVHRSQRCSSEVEHGG